MTSKEVSQRMWLGVAALAVGAFAAWVGLDLARLPANRQTQYALWLQNTVNIIRLFEVSAFGFGAYQFWAGRNERRDAEAAAVARARKDANYQAWQVVNSAQGKGGSGGRIDALADLARNDVSLAGINLDGAWLETIDLRGARLPMASLEKANLQNASLDGARLDGAILRDANLVAAALTGASLKGADLTGARLSAANLASVDLTNVRGWREIATIAHANVEGVHGAPRGFAEWARLNGAVDASKEPRLSRAEESREFRAI
jgi:hypothetical protein